MVGTVGLIHNHGDAKRNGYSVCVFLLQYDCNGVEARSFLFLLFVLNRKVTDAMKALFQLGN